MLRVFPHLPQELERRNQTKQQQQKTNKQTNKQIYHVLKTQLADS